MWKLRHMSLKRKLVVLAMLTSFSALFFSTSLFIANDFFSFRRTTAADLDTVARITGANSASAIDFGDAEAATRTLATLEAKPSILAAAIYKDGTQLATYQQGGSDGSPIPTQPGELEQTFRSGRVLLFEPVMLDGQQIGTVYIEATLGLSDRLVRYAGISVAILVGSSLLALFLSSRLQRVVSKPILDLTQTARTVSENQDYSIRAAKHTGDEIGLLIDQFNGMLGRIEEHRCELNEVNEQLVESERCATEATKTKSQFLANMSHELRTPLNAIIGYSEMLQEEAEDIDGGPELIPDLQKVHSAGRHLLALINDILDLSKIEAGKVELFLESFDVSTMAEDVIATIKPLAAKNRNKLVLECPPEIGTIRADLTKVRQTLFNLLSNACKFTDEGTITLAFRRERNGASECLVAEVTDMGIGIPEESLHKIFEAFSQADASTTRKYGGTGLGLAVSRKFCQLMGGDLDVRSVVGQGSVFTMRINADVKESMVELDPVATTNRSAESGKTDAPTILIIDDDPVARDLLKRALIRDGFDVQTAESGLEGLERAREIKPTAITLDVMMPGMDGWTVLSRLKADPELASIPVVMITINDDKNIGYSLGATDYITKPIDWDQLSRVLSQFRDETAAPFVLVLEENPDARSSLKRSLIQSGWNVALAQNSREALKGLSSALPEVVVAHLGLGGFAFVGDLRRRPGCASLPIVFIADRTLTDQETLSLGKNVKVVVQKGGDSADLVIEQVRKYMFDSSDAGI